MSATVPVTLLRLRTASRELDIEWADGSCGVLPYRILRGSCPCAACRRERRAGGATGARDADVDAVLPCGPNAVQIRFSDGHDRGIFPFSYLRELSGQALTRDPGAGISK